MTCTSTSVAVLILNWNRRDDTLRCLASLEQSQYRDAEIVVIDNASTDGSVESIADRYPDVRQIVNDRNLGYAGGNNAAMQTILKEDVDCVLILNNDTVVDEQAITELVATIDSDAGIGVVGPAIFYLAQPETVWSAGGSFDWRNGDVVFDFHNIKADDLPESSYAVDHITGCSMLLKRVVLEQAGLLDPRFFMYYEEAEWCRRITQAGFRIVVNPRARIWHDIDPDVQTGTPAIAYYMTRNQLLFLRATGAPWQAWASTVRRQIRTVIALFLRPRSLARSRGRVPMLHGMRDFVLGRFGPHTYRYRS